MECPLLPPGAPESAEYSSDSVQLDESDELFLALHGLTDSELDELVGVLS